MNAKTCYSEAQRHPMLILQSEDDVNRRLSLIELAKHYQIEDLVLRGSALCHGACPFCHQLQFRVMPNDGLWICFACRNKGKTLDLVTKLEKVSKVDAIQLINSWICGESLVGSVVCL